MMLESVFGSSRGKDETGVFFVDGLNIKDVVIFWAGGSKKFATNKERRKILMDNVTNYFSEKYGVYSHIFFDIKGGFGGGFFTKSGERICSASFSHSGKFSFAAIGKEDSGFGIDFELSGREVGDGILTKLCDFSFREIDEDLSSRDRIRYWTNIEAVCKAAGHGLEASSQLSRKGKGIWHLGDRRFSVEDVKYSIGKNKFIGSIAIEEDRIQERFA